MLLLGSATIPHVSLALGRELTVPRLRPSAVRIQSRRGGRSSTRLIIADGMAELVDLQRIDV